jgi:hypothetical protein
MNKNYVAFRNSRAVRTMACGLLAVVTILATAGMASAQERTDLKFKGAIGVIPVTGVSATGAVNLNIVRGINPAGPWRIAELTAHLSSDGRVLIKGHGLLLAAGDGIGTNAGATVFATLFCGPATGASAFNSYRATLDADGDFRIEGFLSSVPPSVCDTPVLLIRNAAGSGVWFAAGIPDVK